MVETADDRALLLADFGVTATYTPSGGASSSITVIFDNEFIPVDTGASVSFAMRQPKALARSADIPNVAEGDILVVNSTTYVIRIVMPDGTGMTELMLEAQ